MPSDNPTISVLMPVYNTKDYLPQAVESILQQTFCDFELLLLDDGSIDGSWEIIQEYARKDPRITAIRYAHEGYPSLLNRGLRMARGSLIARMDSDDVALTERFEKQVGFMQANPDIHVLGTNYNYMSEGVILPFESKLPVSPRDVFCFMQTGCCIAHPSVVFRKQTILSQNGYRTQFLPAEDYDLWLRILASHPMSIANLAEPLLLYRIHQGQVSNHRVRSQILNSEAAKIAYKNRIADTEDPFEHVDQITCDQIAQIMDAPNRLNRILVIGCCDRIALSRNLGLPPSNYQPLQDWLNEFTSDTKLKKFAGAWTHLSMASNYHGWRYYREIGKAILRGISSSAFRQEFIRVLKERMARSS